MQSSIDRLIHRNFFICSSGTTGASALDWNMHSYRYLVDDN